MKKFILSIAILFLIATQSFSHVAHYSKYNYLEYELFRNNKLIGEHKFYFAKKNSYTQNQNIFISGITNNQNENIIWQLIKI